MEKSEQVLTDWHAVVLAGGKGSRLRPLTDTRPKPLVPFMGAPFAAGLLRRLRQAGCGRATFLVGQDPRPFAPLVGLGSSVGVKVSILPEEQPLDTAGACRRLLSVPGADTTIVCNGDILTDLDYSALLRAHLDGRADATIALTRVEDTTSFGVVVCDRQNWVERFVEKPPAGTVAADTVNAGTYVLEPDAFAHFPGDGPLSFEREVFPGLLAAGCRVLGLASDAFWADLGTPRRYLDGHQGVLDGECLWPVPDGYRHVEPRVLVHETAQVDDSAVLGPYAVVGAGCHVGRFAQVVRTVLHDGVTVGDYAHLVDVAAGAGSTIAPRANAVGAVLADGAELA